MQTKPELKKFAVLYVDDEEKSLTTFVRAFSGEFTILTAASAREGLEILEQRGDEIGILLTDQRMPGETGIWLLERARQSHPQILRMLVTAYTDMAVAIEAVNNGAIYKYISKPWNPLQLELELQRGLEYFAIHADRDKLFQEKESLLRERMISSRIVNLGLIAAGLNHHIGNRLLTVKTFLDLLQFAQEENSAGIGNLHDADLLNRARADIENILSHLADLRAASANQSGTPFADEISLHLTIAGVLDGMQSAFGTRHIEVLNQIPESLPLIRADKPKLHRLFELLLKDEFAMLPAGCHIRFEAEASIVNGQPGIAIRMTDNGPELPQETLQLVLDPFATKGKPTEYGINLMVCFFIVHHHGGSIEVGNVPGNGNQFIIRLPLHPEPAHAVSSDTDFVKKAMANDQLLKKFMAQP